VISAAHTYANDRATPYAVTVKVTDSTGATATNGFSATVANVAATVTITSPTGGTLFQAGRSMTLSATFSDAGKSDTHTCSIAWGDATSTGTVSETNGAGTCSASHTYANVGNYTITVTVTDNGGAAGTATVAVSVTKNGHGLFLPAGVSASGPFPPPLHTHVSMVTTKKAAHATFAKKTTHHAAKKSLSPAALSGLRRVLRFDPAPNRTPPRA
jgi:hypothetical protein